VADITDDNSQITPGANDQFADAPSKPHSQQVRPSSGTAIYPHMPILRPHGAIS